MGEGGQTVGSAFINGLIASIDTILEDETITNKTQAILDLLGEANKYGTLGQALGEEFMNGLTGTITGISEDISGDGESALATALNTMIGNVRYSDIQFR